MQRLELDDTNSLIGYSGSWTALRGSSRQWNSTIHSTTVKGVSAAINFQGTRVVVYCTIPIGSGTDVLATVTLDSHTTSFSHPTNGSAIYASILYDSGPISDTPHTVTLTNAGSTTDSPLQFDRFHLEGTVFNVSPLQANIIPVGPTPTLIGPTNTGMPPTTTIVGPAQGPTSLSLSGPASPTSPNLSPPASASSTGAVFMTITDSNGGSEVVSLPQDFKATTGSTGNNGAVQPTKVGASGPFSSHLVTTTKADGTVVTEVVDSPRTQSTSTSAGIPKGAIIGCVIGVILFIISVICLLLRRQKNRRSRNGHILLPDEGTPELTSVTPFDLTDRSTESLSENSSAQRTHPHTATFSRSEKSRSISSATDAHSNVSPRANAVTQAPIQPTMNHNPSLPRLTFEYGNEAYVIVPRQYASPASASSPHTSIGRPDTPSSIHSTAVLPMHSVAVLLPALPGASSDLPPSYQAAE